ncbi:hypothetical protein RRG08_011721 [Elysia crispata]|uniref:Integrase catalytic domain-containing protein n=1 Tax=Elysia crispata TaxID=231223 RepID=A0AAE1DXX8_9GAST|nr:hypothetical protein RRG08_011721 [Elysia crispata]
MTYLFTIIDRFTRWPEVAPFPDAHASTRASALLQHWIARFGVPEDITSDRGRQFTSTLWTMLNKLLGIKAKTTTAYHPQANGMVERFHHELKTALKARTTSPNWLDELPMVFLDICSYWRADLDCSPAELVYGSTLRIPGEFLQPRDAPKYVYVRKDSHKHPLQRPYDGQYRVVSKSDKYFTLHVKGRTETVSIDRLKTAFVTQFGNSEEDTPVICPAEPSPTTILGSGPSIVLPVPSSSALQSDDRPGTVSITRSDRIQRRPLRFS